MLRRKGSFLPAAALAAVLGMVPVAASASGTIDGVVLNGVNGTPIPGVELRIDGTDFRTTTDVDGIFRAPAPTGTHVVEVTKENFESQRVGDVKVAEGDVTQFSVVLMPADPAAAVAEAVSGDGEAGSTSFAETITVITDAAATTESAVLLERKQAAEISDLIGQEEFSKNPGGDAAGVLMRVTGVSVQDGKYVYVRGLGDRYSNTTLNGAKLPSTEFEKKVVPLDLFPSDLLDKVAISKSYTADKPGEFAAGSIDMVTRQFPTRQYFSLGLSAAHNSVTTGDDFLTAGDGLSFTGGGGQPIASGIPSEPLVRLSPITGRGFTAEELEAFGEQLVGFWSPRGIFGGGSAESASPDYGFDLGYGNTFGKLGLVLTATQGVGYSNRAEERIFYNAAGDRLQVNEAYDLDYSTEEVKRGGLANFSYAFNGNNRLELRSIFTDLSTSEGRFQEGFFSDLNDQIRDYRVSYRNQEILNLQLRGEHFLSNAFGGGSLLEWRFGEADATTDENRRQTLYLRGPDDQYRLTDNAQSGFMYFNDLNDTIRDGALDFSAFLSQGVTGTVKAGLAWTENDRDFTGRRLRYFHRRTGGVDLTLSPEQLFVEENIGPDGFELEEITRPTDTYDGQHEIQAGYVQVDLAWERWRVIAGARYEDSQLEVVTQDRNNLNSAPLVTLLDEQELPASLSVVYKMRDDMNLRAVASQTVNRPSFRELAPFTFTHIVGGYAIQGNPDLVSATIRSFDLRWEWFPAPTEVIAASIFFKEFDKPIEQVVIPGAEFLETFANAAGAENFGAEIELRRNLGSLSEALSKLTAVFNYTWVDSEIDIDPSASVLTSARRPLVGQPDSVLNAVLEWDNTESDSLVRLLYNMTGDKVGIAGSFGLPDVVEDARSTVDLTYIQGLGSVLEDLKLKISARNLTNETWSWSQGGEPFRRFDKGRTFSLGLSFKF